MGRFEQIALQVANLPMDRQDVIADFIADQFSGDLNPRYELSDDKVALALGELENKYG